MFESCGAVATYKKCTSSERPSLPLFRPLAAFINRDSAWSSIAAERYDVAVLERALSSSEKDMP